MTSGDVDDASLARLFLVDRIRHHHKHVPTFALPRMSHVGGTMNIVVAFALAALALPTVGHAAESPLLAAIRGDHAAAVSRLLAEGESANVRDETGATALMYAVLYSSPAVVRQLLARGADVNAANAA